jgi:hypothetical protein
MSRRRWKCQGDEGNVKVTREMSRGRGRTHWGGGGGECAIVHEGFVVNVKGNCE